MLSSDLRDNAMSLRMLQIGSTFSIFRRLVRDLSDELGKEIELTFSGSETELDKNRDRTAQRSFGSYYP